MIDMAVSTERNVSIKEFDRLPKNKDLHIETK